MSKLTIKFPSSLEEVVGHPYNYDSHRTSGFKVYELRSEEAGISWRWKAYELKSKEARKYKKNPVEVESLSYGLIFLGHNSSMLVMESQFPGFKGNYIYFTGDFTEASCFKSPLGSIELGVFKMEDKTILAFNGNGYIDSSFILR